MARATTPTGRRTRRDLRLVANAALPEGIAVLDAPDIDSVDATNRELAAELLGAADVWVFVTTAARYADAVPWGFLHRARNRGVPLVVVLNRVPPAAKNEVEPHLRSLLTEHGLPDATMFTIEEQTLDAGRLPAAADRAAAVLAHHARGGPRRASRSGAAIGPWRARRHFDTAAYDRRRCSTSRSGSPET